MGLRLGQLTGGVCIAFAGTILWAQEQSIFQVVPTPNGHQGPTNNSLSSVAAASPADIWAVGQTTIHYDGAGWTAFPAPKIHGDNTSNLNGVVDISPTDAWAVGIVNIGEANPGQVIEHWNGTAWNEYTKLTFASGDEASLYGMTAISGKDIWAVGNLLTGGGTLLEALFEHWDGTAWTAHEGRFFGFFRGVSADAANDVWAVGCTTGNTTFSEHFDGTSWALVETPNVGTGPNCLNAVVALAPNDVWAVGYSTATLKPPPGQYDVPTHTLVEHYDGTAWSVVSSPNVGPNSQYQSNRLLGVTAVSPNDIWAFGSYFAASGSEFQITLLMHWDGTSWTIEPCPSPQPGDFMADLLWSGVVTGPGDVWIVGSLDPAAQGKPVTATFVLHTTGG